MNRSPFFYVGDKYKLMKQLGEHFPKHFDTLIEPFVGGGSVFLNTTANAYICNDLNSSMICLHNFLYSFKNNRNLFFTIFEETIKKYGFSASYLGVFVPEDLKKKYVKTYYAKFNKHAYDKLKRDFNHNKQDFLKLYVLLIYGFNHMLRFNKSGDFNLPVGNVDYNKNVYKALNAYFDFIDKNEIVFSNLDFEKFLLDRKYSQGDFVYLDPPYLISACEYNKGWTEESEKRLLSTLDKLNLRGVRFALSNVFVHKGQSNDLLIKWADKYSVERVKSNYISYHDNSIKETIEVLIKNY